MAYIKSHSNYVLKKNHQTISDGTVWERDITTIGGVNQFAPGQIPIYKSSNFIITVRNDGKVANQYNKTKWKENESGNTWTLETISGMTSEFEDQNDIKIILKQDYYDFRDFAYYGSLSEMFRASINDVLSRFPGELYGTGENAYYTSAMTADFEKIEEKVMFGKPKHEGECSSIKVEGKKCIVYKGGDGRIVIDNSELYIDNPFGINIHSIKKPTDAEPLKYFADKGYENYCIIQGDTEPDEEDCIINSWITRNFIQVVKYKIILDNMYGTDAFYYDYLEPEILHEYFRRPDNEVWWIENNNDTITEEGREDYENLVESFRSGEIREEFIKYSTKYWVEKRVKIGVECDAVEISKDGGFYDTLRECSEVVAEKNETAPEGTVYSVGHGARCGNIECYFGVPCKGYKSSSVTAETETSGVIIGAWIGDNNEVVYLSDITEDVHIRPIKKFITKFYNECNNFEKIILDNKTTPLYKSIFSVIKENERGYYREMEEFIFPTSYGKYNIDANSYSFNDYTTRLSNIGEYYDEFFTDNLYRSMTHESIKNFDWTYTREFTLGDEEEYVIGGQKIQKALRIFAREFDEILTYINNIKNYNRITYDERSNIPDYFLIDEAEKKGWDVRLVYPYDLVEYETNEFGEYIKDSDGNKIVFDDYDEQIQLSGRTSDKYFTRNFSQNTKKEIFPYSKKYVEDYPNGYFISCCGDDQPCQYEGSKYHFIDATGSGNTYSDPCEDGNHKIKNKIKSYTDERLYTIIDSNNEFMRRLVINSPYIWRHKGTIEGIEMMLGMFGLRSKRWIDKLTDNCLKSGYTADYEITEYSSFTNRIEEKWDAVHQMYRIDWINSTKAIVYDYRSTSNYTKYGTQPNYVPYQGLPVLYRYEEISGGSEPYIKVSPLDPSTQQETTMEKDEAFKKVGELNEPVVRRYLYPNFDKYEQLDGNPYFQMDGGWLSKTVQNEWSDAYNFQFDVDDNIAYTCHLDEGKDDGDEIEDNHPIYKETVRNIKRVDTLGDLITVPIDTIKDGSIYYVSNIDEKVAIINNKVYPIKFEYSGDENNPLRYVSLVKNDNYIKVGDDKFFDRNIIVYDKYYQETSYYLENKEYGYEVKAYIKDDDSFICKADVDGYYTIDSFMVFDAKLTSAATNYFIIDNTYYSNRISVSGDGTGWRILYPTDPEYIKINTVTNYYEGNNPHNGNMVYDGGHEYFTYFKRLFKYAIDNDLFDERCYESFFNDMDDEIVNIGFKNLIHENEMITQYFPYISGLTESKIHYFGTYYEKDESVGMSAATECKNVIFYGENQNKIDELAKMYKYLNNEIEIEKYILNDDEKMIGGSPYSSQTGTIDEITNQILNNKRLTIKFYLHNAWESNQGQCELKYLDDIVMNYLTQMIPSTTIVSVEYYRKDENIKVKWVEDGTTCSGYNLYFKLKQQISYDEGETWSDTGKEKLGDLIEENSEQCGYVEPQYRTITSNTCIGVDKYENVEQQVSYDGGNTWETTATTRNLIEPNSRDCGYVPPKYRWVIIEGEYECENFDKYAKEKQQISTDDGETWSDTGEEKRGDLIEANSPDCGCNFKITSNVDELNCNGGLIRFELKR